MYEYKIRELKPSETDILKNFTYEAIFQKDDKNLLPKKIIYKPELRIFYENFGKHGDHCLVAEIDGQIIGAVWTRILCGKIRGYGNIDYNTPEFAIALHKEFRNKGIGAQLMQSMLELLKKKGYQQASLAVQKENYAVKMYEKVGFKIIKEMAENYLMVYMLN